jgi:hypothetical protein
MIQAPGDGTITVFTNRWVGKMSVGQTSADQTSFRRMTFDQKALNQHFGQCSDRTGIPVIS